MVQTAITTGVATRQSRSWWMIMKWLMDQNLAGQTHACSAPYENRDPRFAATILYDQALWRPRPADVKEIYLVGKVIIRSVETAPGVWTPGLDTRDGPIEDWNGGYSGYYFRKLSILPWSMSTRQPAVIRKLLGISSATEKFC